MILALKPNDGETFLREVDEELRKEQMNRFVTRYGWWIIAAVVLFLGAIGGWLWWQARSEAAAAAESQTLTETLDSMEAGNRNAAQPKIAQLAQSDIVGVRAAALFSRANAETAAGNNRAATATLAGIAADQSLPELYRQAATVRQTALEFDTLQPQVVVRRLGPLARDGSAWLGTAGEMVAIAYLKMGRPQLAGPLFGKIARDESVPASIRNRAAQMASSLGVEALPDATRQTAPPATREKAE